MQLLWYYSLHKSQATIGLVSVVTLYVFRHKHSSWFWFFSGVWLTNNCLVVSDIMFQLFKVFFLKLDWSTLCFNRVWLKNPNFLQLSSYQYAGCLLHVFLMKRLQWWYMNHLKNRLMLCSLIYIAPCYNFQMISSFYLPLLIFCIEH